MGKNNRQRRVHKHQVRRKAAGARPGGPYDPTSNDPTSNGPSTAPAPDLARLLLDAACAAEHGSPEDVYDDVDSIVTLASRDRRAATAVTSALVYQLRTVWERGWQPADVLRQLGRRFDRGTVAVGRSIVAFESQTTAAPGTAMPGAWAAQIQQVVGRRTVVPAWRTMAEVEACVRILGLLSHLPTLPCLVPPPSKWSGGGERPRATLAGAPPGVNSRMLAKIRALLAKAESTNFDEEAESLTAKAQELMARYSIDQAMVSGASSEEVPVGRRIGVDDPYADPKSLLLSEVAGANRCSAIQQPKMGFSTVFGFAADLDNVEILYTSLLVQATRAMTRAGSVQDRSGRSRTRSYRQSFLTSFAIRIGERLQAASTRATEEASAVHGDALLPVLVRRSAKVDGAVHEAFPETTTLKSRISNYQGWVAGRAAADQAQLGPERASLDGVAV